MTIFTVKWPNHNRQDITVLHKDTKEWPHIDKAVPVDQNVLTIEGRRWKGIKTLPSKIKNPQSHESDTHRDWCTWNHLEEENSLVWDVKSADIFGSAQLSAIVGNAHILRKVWCL